jgi:hypothetical protein
MKARRHYSRRWPIRGATMKNPFALVGQHIHSHPVADALGLGALADDPGDASSAKALIYDCRSGSSAELGDKNSKVGAALAAGKPVLLLSPAAQDLKATATLVGGGVGAPCQAVLIVRHPGAPGVVAEHHALSYPPAVRAADSNHKVTANPPQALPSPVREPRFPRPPAKDRALLSFVDRVRTCVTEG